MNDNKDEEERKRKIGNVVRTGAWLYYILKSKDLQCDPVGKDLYAQNLSDQDEGLWSIVVHDIEL